MMKTSKTTLTLPSLILLSLGALGQTVTVTTAADDVDIDQITGTIADLPGPDGKVSFLEALIATDNEPGHQTIGFAIPQNEWILQFVYPGRVVFNYFLGYRAFDSVTIDGTTQTAFTGDTNPNGHEIAFFSSGLYLLGDNSVLMGFDFCPVSVSGSNTLVIGNTGGMHIDVLGDNARIEGNQAGTIKLDGSSQCVLVGNTMQRVRIWGGTGNQVGGPLLSDRNFITGYGTTNSNGLPSGMDIELFQTQDTVIENNYIGTTIDGLSQGNQFSNVGIGFVTNNTGTLVKNNLIAGILGHGQGPHHSGQLFGQAISLGGTGSGIEIVGNTIGLDANGQPLLGSVWGIDAGNSVFANMSDVRIGGALPGEGNVVAGHILNGITLGSSMSSVRIEHTRVYDNGWLGIDLFASNQLTGVTPNDPLDNDSGANGLQNYPELDSARYVGSALRIAGVLNSTPLSQFTVEFFASATCDDSGFGEGEVYLGSTTVFTDGAGNADVDLILASTTPVGWVVTATAIHEPSGATSEFSACVSIIDDSTGQTLCNGDGGDQLGCTDCPCGNNSAPGTIGGCLNSASTSTRLEAAGDPSVSLPTGSTTDLRFGLADAPPLSFCILNSGNAVAPQSMGNPCFGMNSGVQSASLDGLRCAVMNTRRHGGRSADANGDVGMTNSPWGGEGAPAAGLAGAFGGFVAGQTGYFQVIHRDDPLAVCVTGLNTSQAVAVLFTP